MTAEELREFSTTVARLEGKIETLTALLDATASRHKDEIGELFRRSNDDQSRINKIERDYVPELDFKHHREKNAEAHKELRVTVDAINKQVTRIVTIGAVVWVVLSMGVQVLIRVMMQ